MELTKQQYNYLLEWIKNNLIPTKTFSYQYATSYKLKHIFEFSNDGFYIDEDCMKTAMLECGFRVRSQKAANWLFNVSRESPAFSEPSVQKNVYIP